MIVLLFVEVAAQRHRLDVYFSRQGGQVHPATGPFPGILPELELLAIA
jgi:hypothetical protein